MDCNEVRRKLSSYIDGMLDESETEDIRRHLELCSGCSEALGSMRRVISFMKTMDDRAAPSDFLAKLNTRLEEERPGGGILRRLFYPLHIKLPIELAAAAAALVLVFYFAGPRSTGPPSVTLTSVDRVPYETVTSPAKGAPPEKGKGRGKGEKKGPVDIRSAIEASGARITGSGWSPDYPPRFYLLVEPGPEGFGPLREALSSFGDLSEGPDGPRSLDYGGGPLKIYITPKQ